MNKNKKQIHLKTLLIAVAVMVIGVVPLTSLDGRAHAITPPFTEAFLRLDNLTAQTWTGGRVCFEPSIDSDETANVQVMFPTASGTDYSIGTGAWDLDTNNLDTTPDETALPDLPTTATVSSKTITVTLTSAVTLSTGTLYCFNFSGSASDQTLETSGPNSGPAGPNPETTQGTIATYSSSGVINQSTYSESIITDSTVVVNAVVPPSFDFVLNGNTDTFTGNLSTSSIVSTNGGRYIQITTNAPNGWIVWAEDLNGSAHDGALQSVTAGDYKIAGSVAAPSASRLFTTDTEDYGLGVILDTDAPGGGTVSINSDYDGTGDKAGTLDPTQFQPIASSNGTADGDKIDLYERATIAGQTPAASDYTDTITYTGAGFF